MRSFDVFDTVLTRTSGSAVSIYRWAAGELRTDGVIDADPETMVLARVSAEARLGHLLDRHPTLHEIHDELATALGLHPSVAEVTLQHELRCERRMSVPVPGIAERVKAARTESRVVFLSDTSLTEAFVRELLERAGVWAEGDAIYTSSERRVSKGERGCLFDLVTADLGVAPASIAHEGDHRFADVGEARLHGWNASLTPAARLSRYEDILEKGSIASGGLSSSLAGASRLARLEAGVRGVDPDIAAVASGVAAPLLIGHALWVLQQARQHRLDRLYFVSRDGEVMLAVTRRLAAALGVDVELRYLYGSRSAWHLASLHGKVDHNLAYWLHGHAGDPAREVLHRVGLTPECAFALVPDAVLDPAKAEVAMTPSAREHLHDLLATAPLLETIRATAAERHTILRDYLEQEGLADDLRAGVVDVGWLGRSGRSLDEVMAVAALPPVSAFLHVGLAKGASQWVSADLTPRMHAYVFDSIRPSGVPLLPSGIIGLIETFCTGSEGSVDGYRREGGRVVPVLVRPRHDAAIAWGLDDMRSVIDDTIDALIEGRAKLDAPGDLRGVIAGVLSEFWERPTTGEIATWGRFPFEAAQTHELATPLAAPVRTTRVLRDLRAGKLRLRPATSWRAGTAAVSSPPWRHLLDVRNRLDASRPRLRQLPHRIRLELALRSCRATEGRPVRTPSSSASAGRPQSARAVRHRSSL